jgi:hypothetical protein
MPPACFPSLSQEAGKKVLFKKTIANCPLLCVKFSFTFF